MMSFLLTLSRPAAMPDGFGESLGHRHDAIFDEGGSRPCLRQAQVGRRDVYDTF